MRNAMDGDVVESSRFFFIVIILTIVINTTIIINSIMYCLHSYHHHHHHHDYLHPHHHHHHHHHHHDYLHPHHQHHCLCAIYVPECISVDIDVYFNGIVYLLFAVTIWRLKWNITLSPNSCSQSCSTRSSHR